MGWQSSLPSPWQAWLDLDPVPTPAAAAAGLEPAHAREIVHRVARYLGAVPQTELAA
jgi:hypothetical protein